MQRESKTYNSLFLSYSVSHRTFLSRRGTQYYCSQPALDSCLFAYTKILGSPFLHPIFPFYAMSHTVKSQAMTKSPYNSDKSKREVQKRRIINEAPIPNNHSRGMKNTNSRRPTDKWTIILFWLHVPTKSACMLTQLPKKKNWKKYIPYSLSACSNIHPHLLAAPPVKLPRLYQTNESI